MFDFHRPLKAAAQNIGLWKTSPWGIIAALAGLASDILTPLSPSAGRLAVASMATGLLLCVVCAFLPAYRCPRLFKALGNLIVVFFVFLVGFSTVWGWEHWVHAGPRGAMANAIPDIGKIQDVLNGLVKTAEHIDENTVAISKNVDALKADLKKETSVDPRKELANQGGHWSPEYFLSMIENGDRQAILLFLDGGMPVTAKTDQSLVFYALARKAPDIDWLLDQLLKHGLRINEPLYVSEISGGFNPPTIWHTPLLVSVIYENDDAIRALVKRGADTRPVISELERALVAMDKRDEKAKCDRDMSCCIRTILVANSAELQAAAKSECLFDVRACSQNGPTDWGIRHAAETVCRNHLMAPSAELAYGETSSVFRSRYANALAIIKTAERR